MNTKNKFRTLAVWGVVGLVLLGGVAGVLRAFAADPVPPVLTSFFKKQYKQDDSLPTNTLAPNLLFFVESNSAMLFDPSGIVPTENATYGKGAVNSQVVRQYKANLQEHNTYGGGMRPVMFNSTLRTDTDWDKENLLPSQIVSMDGKPTLIQVQQGFSRFGKDIDDTNNYIGSDDCYYTSDTYKKYLLTFRHRLLAHHNWRDTPNPTSFPTTDIASEDVAAWDSYIAIKDYMPPDGISKDKPVPTNIANLHLVPNDSRMYILKLALWRLLEQSGNDEKFSKINFGLAQPYKEYLNDSSTWRADSGANAIKLWLLCNKGKWSGVSRQRWKNSFCATG